MSDNTTHTTHIQCSAMHLKH